MKLLTKVVLIGLVAAAASLGVTTLALASVDTRAIGRTDPKRAASYRLPWFNFSETYTDGAALGVTIGSSRGDAIRAADRAGFTVDPSGWGDNRAGGASLYSASALAAAMDHRPYLVFYDGSDLKRGMIVQFDGDRVAAVSVHYINSEAI